MWQLVLAVLKYFFDWEGRVERELRLAESFRRKDAALAKRINEKAFSIVRFHAMVHLPAKWGCIQNAALLFCNVGMVGSAIAGLACIVGVICGSAQFFYIKAFGLLFAVMGSLFACALSLVLWNLYVKKNIA